VIGPRKTLNTKYTKQVTILILSEKLFIYSILVQSKPIGKNDRNCSRNENVSIFSSGIIVNEKIPAIQNNTIA
jgi:hypothetical protein